MARSSARRSESQALGGFGVLLCAHKRGGAKEGGSRMEFQLYTDVVLARDMPEEGLRTGDVGTVVERHDVPGREPGYSVEFFDMLGHTVAVVTLPASALRAPTHADRPAVRSQPITASG